MQQILLNPNVIIYTVKTVV